MMIEDDKGIRPGIETMRGLPAFYDGAVVTTSSLTNVSLCVDLDAAKQLDRLQPMIETDKLHDALAAATCVKQLKFDAVSPFRPMK
ncbi:hypothetical protein ACVJGC_002595 [Bradyrhizobium diazoefficiens]